MIPPITASLPEFPHVSPRLFENSSQYNITQSLRGNQLNQYDEYLSNYNSNNYSSNYNSNVTNKPSRNFNAEVKRDNYTRATINYTANGLGPGDDNDCYT